MPTYEFINKETGERSSEFMSMSEVDEYVKNNPHLEWLCSLTAIGDSFRLGLHKPDGEFRDRLKEIKKKHAGSDINTW